MGSIQMCLAEIYENYNQPEHGGDKGTAHSYLETYEQYLDRSGSLLEVGVLHGHSLAMFAEFMDGPVLGLDINLKHLKFPVIAIQCDATKPEQIAIALGDRKFTHIIDDGSHQLHDQIATLEILWAHLEDGGRYFIEDVQSSADLEALQSVCQSYGEVQVFDLREVKDRWDDIIIMIQKGEGGVSDL